MKAYLETKSGYSRYFNVKETTPVISVPEYADIDFATPIMSIDPDKIAVSSMRKDFYLERTFLNEKEEIVGVYKER